MAKGQGEPQADLFEHEEGEIETELDSNFASDEEATEEPDEIENEPETNEEEDIEKDGEEDFTEEDSETVSEESVRTGISEEEVRQFRQLKQQYEQQQQEQYRRQQYEQQQAAQQQADHYRAREIEQITKSQNPTEAFNKLYDGVDRRMGAVYGELNRKIEALTNYLDRERELAQAGQQFYTNYADMTPFEEEVSALMESVPGLSVDDAVGFVQRIHSKATGGKQQAPAQKQKKVKRPQLEVVQDSGKPKKKSRAKVDEEIIDRQLDDILGF